VLGEVRDGVLSIEKARSSYGVVVLPDGHGLDEEGTRRLRAAAV
jgi:hypothetical protein